MYQCFVVRGEHVGPELAGRTVVVTTPARTGTGKSAAAAAPPLTPSPVAAGAPAAAGAATPPVAPFAAAVTGARGCVSVPHIDEVLRRHFAGEPPDWAGIHPAATAPHGATAHTMPEAELLSVA
jgi:hypothetical protein